MRHGLRRRKHNEFAPRYPAHERMSMDFVHFSRAQRRGSVETLESILLMNSSTSTETLGHDTQIHLLPREPSVSGGTKSFCALVEVENLPSFIIIAPTYSSWHVSTELATIAQKSTISVVLLNPISHRHRFPSKLHKEG